jgi:hypothetical protein
MLRRTLIAAGLSACAAWAAAPAAPAAEPPEHGSKTISAQVIWPGPGYKKHYPVNFFNLRGDKAVFRVVLQRGGRIVRVRRTRHVTWRCANGEVGETWFNLTRGKTRTSGNVFLQGRCAKGETATLRVTVRW